MNVGILVFWMRIVRLYSEKITADGKTVQIYMAENEMYDLTISQRNGDRIIARLKRLDNKAFCLNDAYIIEENQIRNESINIPPNLDRRSAHLNIELLERASMSVVKIGFDNNQDRYADAFFSSGNLIFVMPSNRGHEVHLEQTINNHAKTSLTLVGKSIAQQFIHNYMEKALFDGQWNDVEQILPGLFTHIGIQRFQRSP